jgi:hypothetical protein
MEDELNRYLFFSPIGTCLEYYCEWKRASKAKIYRTIKITIMTVALL